MTANELRIGNWVKEFGGYKQITLQGDDLWHTENFEPIPLTPEILEAAGFQDCGSGLLTKDFQDGYMAWRDGELSLNDKYEQNAVWFDFPCKYVHQLQNLFYSLTGTELEINLETVKA